MRSEPEAEQPALLYLSSSFGSIGVTCGAEQRSRTCSSTSELRVTTGPKGGADDRIAVCDRLAQAVGRAGDDGDRPGQGRVVHRPFS
jgi:hypothetical protein